MEEMISNPWIVTVVGSVLATLISTILIYLKNRHQTPSLRSVYEKAVKEVCQELALSHNEKQVLNKALSDSTVLESIETEALGPADEYERLCNVVAHIALPPSPLTNVSWMSRVISQLLYREFIIEGKYRIYHERNDRRRRYFKQALRMQSLSAQESHDSSPSPLLENALPTPSVTLSTFFMPHTYLQGISENCIGREDELEKLRLHFADANRRLVIVEGFGGSGKTTLVARFATELFQGYSVLWIDCQSNIVTADRVLLEVGRFVVEQYRSSWLLAIVENNALSRTEKINGLLEFLALTSDPSKTSLLKKEAKQPVVFIFDDCHLIKDPALYELICKIIECSAQVYIVLMFRHRLQFSAELQSKIDTVTPILLDGLSLEDCRAFISVHAKRYPALKDVNDKALYQIWERTGHGVPTALKLLISMTRTRPLSDILETLPDYSYLSTASKQWFKSLFDELSPAEQQVTTEISLFRRPQLRDALKYMSKNTQIDEIIDALVDRFVLTFDGMHYLMHALWSEYTLKLLSSEDLKKLHLRAAMFYRDFTYITRYARIIGLLESCHHFIKAGDEEQAEDLLISIARTLKSWGLFHEFSNILEEVEKSSSEKGKSLSAQLIMVQADVIHALGDLEKSVNILNNLMNSSTGEVKIKVLQALGKIQLEMGNQPEAEELLKQSQQLAHDCHLPKLEGIAFREMEHNAFFESDYAKMLTYSEQSLNILQAIKDDPEISEIMAEIYHDIGNMYRERGFYDKALELYQQELQMWHTLGDPPLPIGWLMYDMGRIQFERGEFQGSLHQYKKALQLFEGILYDYGIAHVKIELERLHSKSVTGDVSIQLVEKEISLLRRIKAGASEAYALAALGEIYLNIRRYDLALPCLQQSLMIASTQHCTKIMASSLHCIGIIYEQQGKHSLASHDLERARHSFSEAQTTIKRARDLFVELQTIANFGGILDDAVRIEMEYEKLINCNQEPSSLSEA